MSGSMSRSGRGGNVIFQLDMAKAYDRLEWTFLLDVLSRFGFSNKWITLINSILSNCWFSVILNGEVSGFFRSTRGLRQGDPLSPSLFILAEEVLSRGLSRLGRSGGVLPFSVPRGCLSITHLLFADDTIIFVNGAQSSQKVDCIPKQL